MMRTKIAILLVLWMAATAAGWSTKEHIVLTQLAAGRLLADEQTPAEMKAWLRQAAPGPIDEPALREWYLTSRQGIYPRGVDGVAFWSVVPDLDALMTRPQELVQPFGVHERLLHYIDLEYFHPAQQGAAPDQKPVYRPDGSARPLLGQVPHDFADPRYREAGLLPFRIEQMQGKLIESLRAGRLIDRPGQFPRDEHAARWAGCLAHYLADNTQPQHATVDYRSRSFFSDPARAPDVHALMEYRLVDDEQADYPQSRRRVWELLQARLAAAREDREPEDVWSDSVRTSMLAYGALPLIGRAAVAAWRADAAPDKPHEQGMIHVEAFYAFEGDWDGRRMSVAEMKAELQALAVRRIAAHWRKAWRDAHAAP